MKKLLILIPVFFCTQALAQERLMPIMPVEKDSLEHREPYRQMLSEIFYGGNLIDDFNFRRFGLEKTPLLFPENFNLGEIFNKSHFNSYGINTFNSVFSPVFGNVTVLSGATYKLNNKVNFGGYSFGANSILSAPLPNRRMSYFDTRGTTMFLQYNVSKNLKIETRVSVRQGYAPGF